MNKSIVKECIEKAVDFRCTKIVNEYIEFYNTKLEDYDIRHLDCIYYYLLYAHRKKTIDVFKYDKSIYSVLFLV